MHVDVDSIENNRKIKWNTRALKYTNVFTQLMVLTMCLLMMTKLKLANGNNQKRLFQYEMSFSHLSRILLLHFHND